MSPVSAATPCAPSTSTRTSTPPPSPPPTLAGVDAVIDFTAPEAAVENMTRRAEPRRAHRRRHHRLVRASRRDEGPSRKERGGALLYGTNFSIGVQKLFRLTADLAKLEGYTFSIAETHHVSKLDAPSGTAITLREIIEAAQPGQRRSPSHPTASATPRASTSSPHPARSIRSKFATTSAAAAAWPWAPSAEPSGWQTNPAHGISAKSSTSYRIRIGLGPKGSNQCNCPVASLAFEKKFGANSLGCGADRNIAAMPQREPELR